MRSDRKSPYKNACLLAFIAIVIAFPLASFAGDTPVVKVIEIEGLRRISPDAIQEKLTQKEDSTLSPDSVSQDIKSIFEMGYFDDVEAEMEPFEGGLRLVYKIKEKPSIRRVDFFGNDDADDTKIKETLSISPGSMADLVLIQDNADKLRSMYEERGFPLARIVPVLRDIDGRYVLLTYHIEEGPKVKIKDITVTGNSDLNAGRIRRAMQTKRRWFMSWLTGSGYYERAKLIDDQSRIKDLYNNEGYIKALVYEPVALLEPGYKWAHINIKVEEGDRYKIGTLGFSGNSVFDTDKLRDSIKTEEGGYVNKSVLSSDISAIVDMYSEHGYALATVYPDLFTDEASKTVNVRYTVSEGSVFSMGKIDISGNQKTKDKVIRREILLNEGDTFNGKYLKRSYQKINNLGFFDEVSFKPLPRPETGTFDLDVTVKERPTGFLNVGLAYSSVDKVVGMGEYTQGNLGGAGRQLKFKAEFGSLSSTYQLSYREPWLMDKPISTDVSIYNSQRDYTSYKKKANGFSLGFGRRFMDYYNSDLDYMLEEATVYDIGDSASSLLESQRGTTVTSSLSPSISRDSRDNFLNPHTGSRNSVQATYAGIGGDNKFIQVNFDSVWMIPITAASEFSIRGRYGYARGLFGQDVPIFRRYYIGGGTTVRGLRDIGPRDANGVYIGGTRKLIFNAEYTFPLVREARLNGEFFYDAGTAYNPTADGSDFSGEIGLRDTAGMGFRWLSPIGPIRLDWAFNLNPEAGEPDSRWEFSLGTFF